MRYGFVGCHTMFSISLAILSLVMPLFQAAAGRKAATFTQLPAQPLSAVRGHTPACGPTAAPVG